MSNALTGRAAVYGLDGALTFSAIAADAALMLSGANYTEDADVKNKLTDPSSGEIVGLQFGQKKSSITVDMIPVAKIGSTQSTSNANTAAALPSIGSVVTLSSMKNSQQDGSYMYMGGGSISYTPDGFAKMTLPLERYHAGGYSSSASLLAVVS